MVMSAGFGHSLCVPLCSTALASVCYFGCSLVYQQSEQTQNKLRTVEERSDRHLGDTKHSYLWLLLRFETSVRGEYIHGHLLPVWI